MKWSNFTHWLSSFYRGLKILLGNKNETKSKEMERLGGRFCVRRGQPMEVLEMRRWFDCYERHEHMNGSGRRPGRVKGLQLTLAAGLWYTTDPRNNESPHQFVRLRQLRGQLRRHGAEWNQSTDPTKEVQWTGVHRTISGRLNKKWIGRKFRTGGNGRPEKKHKPTRSGRRLPSLDMGRCAADTERVLHEPVAFCGRSGRWACRKGSDRILPSSVPRAPTGCQLTPDTHAQNKKGQLPGRGRDRQR